MKKIKKAKSIIAFLLVMVMIIALAACGKDAGSNSADGNKPSAEAETSKVPTKVEQGEDMGGGNENATITEKPDGIQPGTVFTYWLNSDYPIYVPWLDTRAANVQYQVYDPLVMIYQGNPNDLRPCLAAEMPVISEDGLTYVFKLREDAYFTDGEPVNAEAFVYTWDNATKEYRSNLFASIESYEATGEYELTIKLKAPSATIMTSVFANPQMSPVSPKALAQYGKEDNGSAVGCGPYYVTEYRSGEGYTLKANTNYYHELRQPSIETIELALIPDENTAVVATLDGKIDCMNITSVETYNNLIEGDLNVITQKDRPSPWWINSRVEVLRDATVREAICHMIDWETINLLVYDGRYAVIDSYWGDGPGGVPYGDGYKYDPELGVKMLTDAGYNLADIKFTILTDNVVMAQFGTVLVSQLNELGLTGIEQEILDSSTCFGKLRAGDYDVFPIHNGYSEQDPLTPYTMGMIDGCPQAVMFLKDFNPEAFEEAMTHYQAAVTSGDFDTYVKEVEAITQIVQDNYCAFGSLGTSRFYAVNKEFSGIYPVPISGYMEFFYLYSNVG